MDDGVGFAARDGSAAVCCRSFCGSSGGGGVSDSAPEGSPAPRGPRGPRGESSTASRRVACALAGRVGFARRPPGVFTGAVEVETAGRGCDGAASGRRQGQSECL